MQGQRSEHQKTAVLLAIFLLLRLSMRLDKWDIFFLSSDVYWHLGTLILGIGHSECLLSSDYLIRGMIKTLFKLWENLIGPLPKCKEKNGLLRNYIHYYLKCHWNISNSKNRYIKKENKMPYNKYGVSAISCHHLLAIANSCNQYILLTKATNNKIKFQKVY